MGKDGCRETLRSILFGFEGTIPYIILDSSMVEHSAVNRVVVGSSPTRGAKRPVNIKACGFFRTQKFFERNKKNQRSACENRHKIVNRKCGAEKGNSYGMQANERFALGIVFFYCWKAAEGGKLNDECR